MKISLIMATVGRTEEIGRMVDSLLLQTDCAFELIIIDQNDDDRLLPYIETGRTAGIDIRHERFNRKNLSAARNFGISQAQYEILAFPDDDCWYDSQVIETIRAAFNDEPRVDGVIAKWEEEQCGGGRVAAYTFSNKDWRRFRGGSASSITLFIRHGLFSRIGGFDSRLGVGSWYGAGEETDFILRALVKGARIDYCPLAMVHHRFQEKICLEGFQEIGAVCRNVRRRARGIGAIYAKHNLDTYVILRGLLAPVFMPIIKFQQPISFMVGVFVAIGRLEGYLRWEK